MRAIAVVGHLARDVVDGGPPRIGGAPWYAARALRVLGRPVGILAKCGEPERRPFVSRLSALGMPATVVTGGATSAFALRYDPAGGGGRQITVDAVGDPWRPAELAALRRAVWVHVAPLLRSDFPAETVAALARDRRLLLDAQGLVRVPELGPLRLDADFDRSILGYVSILKLAEEEAALLEPLEELGVPEIVVTLGERGAHLLLQGRTEEVRAHPVRGEVDPTGAGDAFAAVYLAARAAGHAPVSAARRATALVAGLLAGEDAVTAAVATVEGVLLVDVDAEEVLGEGFELPQAPRPRVDLPRVVAAAEAGSTVVVIVDRRPPLALSHDGGSTWREAGGGLPPGFAVAIDPENPDRMLYAARNRLYLSENGGVFWRSLAPELPDIEAVAWL